jgi:hypothetical protein
MLPPQSFNFKIYMFIYQGAKSHLSVRLVGSKRPSYISKYDFLRSISTVTQKRKNKTQKISQTLYTQIVHQSWRLLLVWDWKHHTIEDKHQVSHHFHRLCFTDFFFATGVVHSVASKQPVLFCLLGSEHDYCRINFSCLFW